ncbi:MAG TPA: DPP IV N-terminal domain-containing protein [Thermoanaerobaculia bacterium]|nr:DPP IV N-terminal domain-containing protein [Thermoanaerobaculia bacterium]
MRRRLVHGTLPCLVGAFALAVPALAIDEPVWSADGETLVGLLRAGRSTSVSAFRGANGERRWSARLPGRVARGLRSLAAAPDGGLAAISSNGDIYLAAATGARRLTRTPALESGIAFSPDGRHLAFARDRDLWAIELDGARETRLTSGGIVRIDGLAPAARRSAPSGFAWSPDSRSIAFLRAGPGASEAIGVVEILAPVIRYLDLDRSAAGRKVEAFYWRFDALAIAVVSRPAGDSAEDELALCHPEKLHCRRLASRAAVPDDTPFDELIFLTDGLLWTRWDDAAGTSLAFLDTLGRDRGRIASEGRRLESVEMVYDESREVVVAARRVDSPDAPVEWLVLGLSGRAPRSLGGEPGSELVFSPLHRSFVRTRREGGRVVAQTIETLDGANLADLPLLN